MSIQSTAINNEPASKTRLRLWLRLLKVSRIAEAELREKLRVQFDSTLPRFDVMSALYEYADGLKMSQLSGVLKVSNGNVTGIVDRLVNDGYVLRSAVPGDRRALLVKLSKKGRSEFLRQAARHEVWVDDLLAELTCDEAQGMIHRLDRVIPTLNEEASHT